MIRGRVQCRIGTSDTFEECVHAVVDGRHRRSTIPLALDLTKEGRRVGHHDTVVLHFVTGCHSAASSGEKSALRDAFGRTLVNMTRSVTGWVAQEVRVPNCPSVSSRKFQSVRPYRSGTFPVPATRRNSAASSQSVGLCNS